MTLLRTQTYSAIELRLFLSYMMVFQLIFLPLLMASCPQSLSVHQKLLSHDFLVTLGTGLTAFNSKDWFMDVTHGTNRQQRDLFMLAIRTPTVETFPGYITIIPSQKRWIFHCIYRMHLYMCMVPIHVLVTVLFFVTKMSRNMVLLRIRYLPTKLLRIHA